MANSRSPRAWIGTSGWIYNDWRGRFYPEKLPTSRWFAHYAQSFDTVEINNTFYRLPLEETFAAWRDQAPSGFMYAVKASRFLTHMKKLKDPADPLDRILGRSRELGRHLGPVLYQLPPRWQKNVERLDEFCAALPKDLLHVVEFREPGWLHLEVYQVLRQHRVCMCVHDIIEDHPVEITGAATYVRFHGTDRRYGGSYPKEHLKRWAEWIKARLADRITVYVYFNNDRGCHAIYNALTLKELLG